MNTMLPYIPDQVGLPIACQPYRLKDADMAVFMLDAEAEKLNALLDTYINQPSNGIYDYRTLIADSKSLCVMIMAQMSVDNRSQDGVLYGKERYSELSFWIPCYDHAALLRGRFQPALFLPFLFPDSFTAIATGREMFGFRKQLATFRYPDGKLDVRNPQFTATTSAFKTLGAESEAQQYDFIRLEDGSCEQSDHIWQNSEDAAEALIAQFLGKQWFCSKSGQQLGNIANDFLSHCPAIFIKQFPAIEDAKLAASRSMTETTFRLDAFHGGFPWLKGLHAKQQALQFAKLASHPLVATLGLSSHDSNAEFDTVLASGFWTRVDFTLETGRTAETVKPAKQKIAVLGGGIGALSAVYGITQDPDWQQKYDITLYQMGWRLGGKGASGRNQAIGDRIEEHGLHIWLGYYDNAFRLMQNCYAELNRPPNTPLATWDAAFKKHNTIVLEEYAGDRWQHWPLSFAPNAETPGMGEDKNDHPLRCLAHLRDLLLHLQQTLTQLLQQHEQHQQLRSALCEHSRQSLLQRMAAAVATPIAEAMVQDSEHLLASFFDRLQQHCDALPQHQDVSALAANLDTVDSSHWYNIIVELRGMLEQMLAPFADVIDTVRNLLTMLDVGLAIAHGVLADEVWLHGYQAINQYDFTQWLINNGASKRAANSAMVRAFYDLCLAFPDGKNEVLPGGVGIGGNVAAGELLHSYILITLCYKGAVMWKMQAGMGDVVMTPIYQVLRQRGVKFEFFHKVSELKLAADGKNIGQINIDVQATLKPGLNEYKPLYDVKGLPCWPSAPLYWQLEQGQALRDNGIDLESSWSPWPAVAQKSLLLGQDFDQVVLGISVAALPYITSELSAANPAWQAMLANSNTSASQAMQLWLNINLEETGWSKASPVLDAYAEPFNTWAAMDQTLDKENWPQNALPFGIAYFCNNMKDAEPIPPFSDHSYPARAKAQVKEQARQWLKQYTGHLWPYATQADGKALDWDRLVDIENRNGEARLDGQYFRANVEPTERYVCNAANTNQYRLACDQSGFANLYLAGDWVNNGSLNLGCVESTVISGLQAARALTKYDIGITRGTGI